MRESYHPVLAGLWGLKMQLSKAYVRDHSAEMLMLLRTTAMRASRSAARLGRSP